MMTIEIRDSNQLSCMDGLQALLLDRIGHCAGKSPLADGVVGCLLVADVLKPDFSDPPMSPTAQTAVSTTKSSLLGHPQAPQEGFSFLFVIYSAPKAINFP